jgi:hypothetical protein
MWEAVPECLAETCGEELMSRQGCMAEPQAVLAAREVKTTQVRRR